MSTNGRRWRHQRDFSARLDEARRGEFELLSEKEMLEELKLFVENLNCDCSFITHHTISDSNLSGPDFLGRKEKIVACCKIPSTTAIWIAWLPSTERSGRCKGELLLEFLCALWQNRG